MFKPHYCSACYGEFEEYLCLQNGNRDRLCEVEPVVFG